MLSKSCELRNDRRNVMLHVTFCKRDKLFQFSKAAENVFHPFPTFLKNCIANQNYPTFNGSHLSDAL